MRRRLLVGLAATLAAPLPAAQGQAAPPRISAPAAFVVQPDTRDVVFGRNARDRRPIASATKLMTALVALGELELSDRVTVPAYESAPAESVAGLRGGERLTVADLMRALMLPSANDAAYALAVLVAGDVRRFVGRMNARARALGLRNTRFANPIGLDAPGNYSSAEDLVKMALLLRANPFVREIVAQPRAVLRSGVRERVVLNRNDLVGRVPFVTGVKTGYTLGAGYVLVGSATRGGVTVVSAVLGAGSEAARDADSLALLRYGLGRYERGVAAEAREVLRRLPVADQDGLTAALSPDRTLRSVVRRGERLTVRVSGVPGEVEGPLAAGTRLGTVQALRRGEVVGETPLVLMRAIPAPSAPEKVRAWISRPGTLLLVAFLAGCTVLLVLLRRRLLRGAGAGDPEVQ